MAGADGIILPGATLGILGGGQLGRMTAMAARSLGYRVLALDPDPSCPASFVVDTCFSASLDDAEAAAGLARVCDVVTIEIEKVGIAAMQAAAEHAPVRPSAEVLRIIQHRARQKDWLARNNFPVGPSRAVASASELQQAAVDLGPLYVKAAQGGYDGRGQARLEEPSEASQVWSFLGAEVCLAEKALDVAMEISVLAARRPDGQTLAFPPALNHHENRILDWSVIPAPIDPSIAARASGIAVDAARALGVVGLLAVEMFVTRTGELLVNELAPRPHNSYHSSERACATSQFEQVVRAVCGLPLGSVEVVRPAAIINILGDLWQHHPHPRFEAALSLPGVRLHLYDKQVPKPGRKMGHLSAIAATPQEAVELVKQAKRLLER